MTTKARQEFATFLHKLITMNDYKPEVVIERKNYYTSQIEETSFSTKGKTYNLDSWRDVYTLLMQEACKQCKHYCTDILDDIDVIKEIRNDILNFTSPTVKRKLIGFHDTGVDHTLYMKHKFKSPEMYGDFNNIYSSIYMFEFQTTQIREHKMYHEFTGECIVTLTKIK